MEGYLGGGPPWVDTPHTSLSGMQASIHVPWISANRSASSPNAVEGGGGSAVQALLQTVQKARRSARASAPVPHCFAEGSVRGLRWLWSAWGGNPLTTCQSSLTTLQSSVRIVRSSLDLRMLRSAPMWPVTCNIGAAVLPQGFSRSGLESQAAGWAVITVKEVDRNSTSRLDGVESHRDERRKLSIHRRVQCAAQIRSAMLS